MNTANILPNCLTKTPKIDHSMSGRGGNWFYLFCANCGADGGRVQDTYLSQQFAFYLCNDCAETYGAIAGTYMVPDEVFWQKVNSAQLEEFGRELSATEIVEALQDASHILSKLAKEKK
jgi:hypothetical protein